jgi:hypothetical protein
MEALYQDFAFFVLLFRVFRVISLELLHESHEKVTNDTKGSIRIIDQHGNTIEKKYRQVCKA